MNCSDLPQTAPAYHAGELDETAAARYERHLASCEPCRGGDGEYRQGLALLGPWPVEPSRRRDEELLRDLWSPMEPQTTPRSSRQSALRRRLPLALAAGLLLAVAGLPWLRPSAPPPPQEASLEILAEGGWGDEAESDLADAILLAWAEGWDLEEAEPKSRSLETETLEGLLWDEAARETGELEAPWPEAGPSLQEELDDLEAEDLQRLVELFDKG